MKFYKSLAVLILVGALSAGVGYAAGVGKTITVYDDIIQKIMVYGQDKTPVSFKPFVYQGTTYVPLRYLSDTLGHSVFYDDQTRIIYIGTGPTTIGKDIQYLVNRPFESTYSLYVYRKNNSLDAAYNQDMDAGFSFPQDFRMSYKDADGQVVVKENGISFRVSKQVAALYYKTTTGDKFVKGMASLDARMNKTFPACTVLVKVDGNVRQTIELSLAKPYGEIFADISGGERFQIEVVSPEKNEEPIINLTDMIITSEQE